MTKRVTIKQAAIETGLKETAIRTGIAAGIYPAFRVGASGRGKFMLDLEELNKVLKELALANIKTTVEQNEAITEAAKGGEDDEIIPFTKFRLVK